MSVLQPLSLSHQMTWSNITRSDLAQMHRTLLTSSAGATDPKHRYYYPWLNSGFKQSNRLAKSVSSYPGYEYTLRYYAAGFRDEHIQIRFTAKTAKHTPKLSWPGFFIHYNNKQFLVSAYHYPKRHLRLPQVNAQLISCNGKRVKNLMLSRLFPYYGNPKLQSDWVAFTPYLLVDRGNPFISKLNQCVFKYHQQKKAYRLDWRTLPEVTNLRSVAWPYKPRFGVSSFAKKQGVWVNIISFSPRVKGVIAHLKKLVKLSPSWRDKKYIVLDVRGNGGGNSGWGELILKGIYGEKYFHWAQAQAHVHFTQFWRVSTANYNDFITRILPSMAKQYGKSSFDYKVFHESAKQMKLKLDNNQQGYVPQKQESYNNYHATTQQPKSLTHAKVMIVTDGRCGSSCLSFLDQAVNIPGITLVGKDSHADSIYTELRTITLHSGYATFGIPTKMTYFRKRANNQPYHPNIRYKGDINNTKQLKHWLAAEILKK